MGDDGFLRRMTSSIRKPHYYGDTNWFSGEVINKYKDKVEDVEYAAVDIMISVMNEVGENGLPGKATVYLPSRELVRSCCLFQSVTGEVETQNYRGT